MYLLHARAVVVGVGVAIAIAIAIAIAVAVAVAVVVTVAITVAITVAVALSFVSPCCQPPPDAIFHSLFCPASPRDESICQTPWREEGTFA